MVLILFVNQPRLNGVAVPREVECANPQKDFFIQPLALGYLASAARKYVSVDLVDAMVLDKDYDYIESIIKKEKPKIVIGGFTTGSLKLDMRLGEISRKHGALFGIFGPLPSSIRDFLFNNFELDFIIENEPEMVMADIAKNIKEGKDFFKNVKGVSYKVKEKIVWNGFKPPEKDLENLPTPAFDLMPMNKYSTPYNRKLPMTILRTSRGCVAKCIFCMIGGQTDCSRGYGCFWRPYSAKKAVDEIELVVNKYGVKEINFFDAEFTINKKRVIDICKEMLRRKIDVIWNCNARVDFVDEGSLKWMKKAGCYSISYGLESANEEVLKICKKNITTKQVEEAIVLTKKYGIQPALFCMIGLPGETVKSANETIDFAKNMALRYNLRPQCTIATPYPGTVFYEMAKENNWYKEDLEKLDQTTACVNYPRLSADQLEVLHRKFYRKVVLHPKRLFKRILRIRHWNEIKTIPVHAKEFTMGFLTKLRYLR